MTRKQIIISLAAVLALSLAAVAYAGPNSSKNFQQLTPEKQEIARKLVDNFREETTPLRDQLWSKQAELDALVQAKLVTKDDIKSMIGEIADIRSKITQKREAFRAELEQETGLASLGRGGSGYGRGNNGGRGGGSGGNGRGGGGGYGGDCPRF